MNHSQRPRILLGRGPRACERRLLAALDEDLERLGPQLLQQPVHILVPSHSLRHHLLARLVRHRGGSVAGVVCWTLRGLAMSILERLDEPAVAGDVLLPVLVRRLAQREAPLRDALEHLHDGYSALVTTVTDLIEAGLDPAHTAALEESLASEGRLVATAAEIRRAAALVRVAATVQMQMTELGLDTDSTLLSRAAEALLLSPEPPLGSSGFHIYGFVDATGLATDFVLAVLDAFGGRVYLDQPPDPIDWDSDAPVLEFGRRFRERLTDQGELDPTTVATAEPSRVRLFSALGAQAEVREVGWRIRELLDGGTRPESVAIVARQLAPYRSPLRTHLGRLGIPFSGVGAPGPVLPFARRISALLEILSRRQRARVERWIDARIGGFGRTETFDLLLALHGLGVGRLDDLAHLSTTSFETKESLPLPARLGFREDDPTTLAGQSGGRLTRRRLPVGDLRRAIDEALDLLRLLERSRQSNRLGDHLDLFRDLIDQLGWSAEPQLSQEVSGELDRTTSELPADLEMALDDWIVVLERSLDAAGRDRLGGDGGGVQILDVIEARGRTFEHLFVLGLNKGVFPRTVREDPALPDSLRHVLGREGHGVLPDLDRKLAGHSEERQLFAQLFASASHVTLSWQEADDDSREATVSPLVERLLWSHSATRGRSPMAPPATEATGAPPRTAYESAVRAALWGTRRQLQANLAAALPSGQQQDARRLAGVRLAIVDEMDPAVRSKPRLGPYFGFVGAASDTHDPRSANDPYITTLESLAVCPWRTFLERVLRLEPLPDAVEILPGLDPFLIGQLVHRALERIARRSIPAPLASLQEARRLDTQEPTWPKSGDLLHFVERLAEGVALEQGIAWPGFATVLARVAVPYLEVARQLVWEDSTGARPVAVETDGELPWQSGEDTASIRFRVDLVTAVEGHLILSDFKTGVRGISKAARQSTRDRHLRNQVRQGRLLQAPAYARSAGRPTDTGRYVFLHPNFDGPDDTRIVDIAADDAEVTSAFDHALGLLIESWRSGFFFPRLVEVDKDEEPAACRYCSVAEACLRGDSGARARIRDWAAADSGSNRQERRTLPVWRLASTRERPS